MPEKIAVTGGAGWIGGWVVRELVDHGYDVVVLDRNLPPDTQNARVVSMRPAGVMRPWQYATANDRIERDPTSASRSMFSYTDPRDLAVLFRLAVESNNLEAACTAVFAVQNDSFAIRPVCDVLPLA